MKSPRLSKPRPRVDGVPSQIFPVPDNARPDDFEVRGHGYTWYVIFRGIPITRDYRYFHKAQEACDAMARRARIKDRPCITCGTSFPSEGIGNRMCDKCRRELSEVA